MKNTIIILLLFTGIVNAQVVTIPDANFKAAILNSIALSGTVFDINNNPIDIDINLDGEIQLDEALLAYKIIYTGLVNPQIDDLTGLESFTNLRQIVLTYHTFTMIDVSAMANLQDIMIQNTNLDTLDLTGLQNLININCPNNALNNLILTGSENTLTELRCYNNQLTNINVTGFTALNAFECDINLLSSLDVSTCTSLTILKCDENLLTSIDVSTCTGLIKLEAQNNDLLQTVFLKNGAIENIISLNLNPQLQFICADEEQVATLQAAYPTVVVNSYCTFIPGGNYNTIAGTARFDAANDGCDTGDSPVSNIRININDGTANGASFTNGQGTYTFYVGAGNLTLTPGLENPGYFNIDPVSSVLNFPSVDNSTQTQNFCITANGLHPDLEVVVVPIGSALTGSDALYNTVYKNKGNQILSGTVTMTFNDEVMDFISSVPAPNIQLINSLIFNYSDLLPFENREILITMNVNSPTDVPPVNIDDTLNFIAVINPIAGDENAGDNVFEFNQTVVGSYDPNAKTCLEGDVLAPNEIGNYLHYIINFENIGTGTATNVVVKDTINTTQFDISTLQVMNSSHPVEIKMTGNVVEFIFENINLPSAIADPIGGHGNVLFKIKTLPDLPVGTMVSNIANIYFDYNFPIETNEARTTFETLSKVDFIKDESISTYPNPANDVVNIKAANIIKSVQLFDIQGRILQSSIENKNAVMIDISDKQNGIYFIKITTVKGSKVEKIIKG